MRSSIFLSSLLSLGLCACGPQFAVIPHGGAPLVTASQAGVYFTAFAEQWDGDPRDLADYVTPIAVDIYNGTQAEVRISYADFALTSNGVRVPALNPFEMPAATASSTPIPGNPTLAIEGEELKMGPLFAGPIEGPAGSMLATYAHGGGGGGGGRGGGGGHFGGGASVRGGFGHGYGGPRIGWGGRAYGAGARWGRGFYGIGGLRRWYGVGGLYWGGPWIYGPGYGLWVTGWGVGVYGDYGRPSPDVVDLALPEGVLEPGAHINGYLFFRKATGPNVQQLSLAWTSYDARTGALIGTDRVQLDVVHR
jgi:hypothetical protein